MDLEIRIRVSRVWFDTPTFTIDHPSLRGSRNTVSVRRHVLRMGRRSWAGLLASVLSTLTFCYQHWHSLVPIPGEILSFFTIFFSNLLIALMSIAQMRGKESLRRTRDDLKRTVEDLQRTSRERKQTEEALNQTQADLARASRLSSMG
jgi:C4-dicarboxylate-specific signal transduction histidine kinase